MTVPTAAHSQSSAAPSGFIAYALAAGVVVFTVMIAEQNSRRAAWGLVAIILMGAIAAHPKVLSDVTDLLSGATNA